MLRQPGLAPRDATGVGSADAVLKTRRTLLYIEPQGLPLDEPVIDDLTMKMVGALRKATLPHVRFVGFHLCVCGAASDSADRIFPNGWITYPLRALSRLPPRRSASRGTRCGSPALFNGDTCLSSTARPGACSACDRHRSLSHSRRDLQRPRFSRSDGLWRRVRSTVCKIL